MEVSLLAQGFRIDGINNCVCVGGAGLLVHCRHQSETRASVAFVNLPH